MRRSRLRCGLFCALTLAVIPDASFAQCSTSETIALFQDPSVRSLGMGGASGPVFWGGDPNDWANPARLGDHRGVRIRYSKLHLFPEFANDASFTSTRITMGAYGVGLSFAGLPDHLGGATLDHGTFIGLDRNSQIITLLNSWERVDSFGIGINVLELAESVLGSKLGGSSPSRWGDVSIGWSRKTVKIHFVPPLVDPLFAAEDRAWTNDLGFAVRVKPIDTAHRDGWGPRLEALGGMTFDVSFAVSSRNHTAATITFVTTRTDDPIARDARLGLAARTATGLPPSWRQRFEGANLGWLAAGFAPLLSIGGAWDRSSLSLPPSGGGDRTECSTGNLYGVELGVANVVTLRWGYVDRKYFGGHSWGLGLGLPLGDFAGIRYDHATSPQGGLERRRDQGVMVWFDGVALAKHL